jgi:hypothetical protein
MVGTNDRVARPIRLETVEMIRVQEWRRWCTRIAVAVGRTVAGLAGRGYDPVPVDCGDIIVLAGRRVPAQQMIVEWADFADAVMVPDIVKIRLR